MAINRVQLDRRDLALVQLPPVQQLAAPVEVGHKAEIVASEHRCLRGILAAAERGKPVVAAIALLGDGSEALGAECVHGNCRLTVVVREMAVMAHRKQPLPVVRKLHVVDGATTSAPVDDFCGAQLVFIVPQIHVAAVAPYSERGAATWTPNDALHATVEETLRVRDRKRAEHVDQQLVFPRTAVLKVPGSRHESASARHRGALEPRHLALGAERWLSARKEKICFYFAIWTALQDRRGEQFMNRGGAVLLCSILLCALPTPGRSMVWQVLTGRRLCMVKPGRRRASCRKRVLVLTGLGGRAWPGQARAADGILSGQGQRAASLRCEVFARRVWRLIGTH